jgi:hypothetical protein
MCTFSSLREGARLRPAAEELGICKSEFVSGQNLETAAEQPALVIDEQNATSGSQA